MWHTHGWSLHTSTRTSRATAASWLKLALSHELNGWEEKRGGFWQHNTHQPLTCSFQDEKRVRLRHSSESIARSILTKIGVDAASLKLAAVKLLRSSHGQGQQEIHYDIPEYARALRCFSVLLYLTSTLSTAVPIMPLDQLRDCFTEGEKRPSADALKLLSPDRFHTTRAEAGDMLVFNCTVPHYGVTNPDTQDRHVLFRLFSPTASTTPDTEEQRYPRGVKD